MPSKSDNCKVNCKQSTPDSFDSQKDVNKPCQCSCHDNKLNKPYEHDTKCCENMNGTVLQKEHEKSPVSKMEEIQNFHDKNMNEIKRNQDETLRKLYESTPDTQKVKNCEVCGRPIKNDGNHHSPTPQKEKFHLCSLNKIERLGSRESCVFCHGIPTPDTREGIDPKTTWPVTLTKENVGNPMKVVEIDGEYVWAVKFKKTD